MIIYEVNIEVEEAIANPYFFWLEDHIVHMTELDGFVAAKIFEIEGAAAGKVAWCVHYQVESRQALEHYFEQHADKMRSASIEKFKDQFSINRRILATTD